MRFNYRKKTNPESEIRTKTPNQNKSEISRFLYMLKVLISSPLTHKYSVTAAHTVRIKRLISINFNASGINAIAYVSTE